ncbi:hypothetical protein G6F56_001026 [Rhizopus delemar]|uniref:Hpc2-related domain-containing protein n=1 Tax=Rhizopus stolonifer TaxID=4846 RepID=A0A367J998_RHIST|nr:hypothetical protein G6F56_001026 [Rhizopus delemar]RCH86490.1 hypothetical protein CU098_000547 [Rhizopus stolonifer]
MFKPSSTRFHIDIKAERFPVIFSYHQLKKREHKNNTSNNNHTLPLSEDAQENAFFKELLEKAEKYGLNGEESTEQEADDEDNDGSDEDSTTGGPLKNDDYDFADPFIDDSEMMLDDSVEYNIPEIDGFFVYQGPLDASKTTEEKKAPVTSSKRKAAAKPKSVTVTSTKATKTRKKDETQPSTSIPKGKAVNRKTIPTEEPVRLASPYAAPKVAASIPTLSPSVQASGSSTTHTFSPVNQTSNNSTTHAFSSIPQLTSSSSAPGILVKNSANPMTTPAPIAAHISLTRPIIEGETQNKQRAFISKESNTTKILESNSTERPTVVDIDSLDEAKKKAAELPVLVNYLNHILEKINI